MRSFGQLFDSETLKMERWQGKVAVVTGASAGIGLATAKQLVRHGLIVIGLARRQNTMIDEMKDVKGPGQFYAKQCDVSNEQEVIDVFDWIINTFKELHVLVNNAGVVTYNKIIDCPTADLERVFGINVFGALHCTRHAIKLMKENSSEAHIIIMNSVVGHKVEHTIAGMWSNVYPATKHAITAISETLRNELKDSKIRITNITPGPVRTEMLDVGSEEVPILKTVPALRTEDVADTVVYSLGVPAHVEINEIILKPKSFVIENLYK